MFVLNLKINTMILNITKEEAKIIKMALRNEKEVIYSDTAENHDKYHNQINTIMNKIREAIDFIEHKNNTNEKQTR